MNTKHSHKSCLLLSSPQINTMRSFSRVLSDKSENVWSRKIQFGSTWKMRRLFILTDGRPLPVIQGEDISDIAIRQKMIFCHLSRVLPPLICWRKFWLSNDLKRKKKSFRGTPIFHLVSTPWLFKFSQFFQPCSTNLNLRHQHFINFLDAFISIYKHQGCSLVKSHGMPYIFWKLWPRALSLLEVSWLVLC